MRSQINRHSLLLVAAFLALLFPSDVYANSMKSIHLDLSHPAPSDEEHTLREDVG